MFDPREKIALFIDGANLYATAKSLGFDIDYRRLLQEFQGKGYLLRAYYYTALAEDQEYSSIRPLIDWLDYNGYTVVTKPTKEFVDASGRRKIKGNMDIELAVHAMEMAEHVDHLVLFSGDGDFRSLVEAVQRRGRKVSVVSTLSTQPPMIADELRRQADHFIDLATLQQKIGRDPAERAQRQAERAQAPTGFEDEFEEDDATLSRGRCMPAAEPPHDCPLCPRLVAFRDEWRAAEPAWHNAPVPTFGSLDARLLIVGLAPGLRGANRTGRPFTGDYRRRPALPHADRLRLRDRHLSTHGRTTAFTLDDAAITNAVRCVPPENKPLPREIEHLPAVPLGDDRGDAAARGRSSRSAGSPMTASSPPSVFAAPSAPFAHGADASGRPPRVLRQLPLLPLQHEHRRPHRSDVQRRLPRHP